MDEILRTLTLDGWQDRHRVNIVDRMVCQLSRWYLRWVVRRIRRECGRRGHVVLRSPRLARYNEREGMVYVQCSFCGQPLEGVPIEDYDEREDLLKAVGAIREEWEEEE